MRGVRYTWGIRPQLSVMPGSDIWRALDKGMIVRDMTFKPELEESQQAIYNFEEDLMKNPDYEVVVAPMHAFKYYLYNHTEHSFPVPQEKFHELILKSALYSTYKNTGNPLAESLGFNNSKLVYMMAKINRKGYYGMNFKEAQECRDEFYRRIKNFQDNYSNEGTRNVFVSAYDNLAWLRTKELFVESSIQGVVLSCFVCFFILSVMTGNYLLTIYAILSIITIVLAVMSMIFLMGWDFGLVQSTCIIVFIGISFDYVVHISHQYLSSNLNTRRERMDHAYTIMGETIFAGALTTSFSGIGLLLCQTDALNKFGVLLMTTVISSMFVALLFLPAFMYFIGPEEDQGSIWHTCLQCIYERFCLDEK